jgi:hypothetical protein
VRENEWETRPARSPGAGVRRSRSNLYVVSSSSPCMRKPGLAGKGSSTARRVSVRPWAKKGTQMGMEGEEEPLHE